MSIALDLVAKNSIKDADELEARLRSLACAGIVNPSAGEEVQPPPPDPKAQAEMAQAPARVQSAQLAVERESVQVQEATLRLQAEVAKIQAETGRKLDTTILDAIEKERKHAIEAARVRMEQERLEHERHDGQYGHSVESIGANSTDEKRRRKVDGTPLSPRRDAANAEPACPAPETEPVLTRRMRTAAGTRTHSRGTGRRSKAVQGGIGTHCSAEEAPGR
jgi:hypothetical protein